MLSHLFKKTIALILTIFILLNISAPAFALTIQEVPNPRVVYGGWVTDMANILTPEHKSTINQIISEYERKTGTEIAVVTVDDTSPSLTVNFRFHLLVLNYLLRRRNKRTFNSQRRKLAYTHKSLDS